MRSYTGTYYVRALRMRNLPPPPEESGKVSWLCLAEGSGKVSWLCFAVGSGKVSWLCFAEESGKPPFCHRPLPPLCRRP